MGIEKILGKTGRKIAHVGLASLFGLCSIGVGAAPAYAQQNVKYASKKANVNYIPCTPQPQQQKATTNQDDNAISSELLTFLGIIGLNSNKPDAQNLGAFALRLGEMQHQKEVAREGRTQITINQGGINQGGQNREVESRELEKYLPAPGCEWANPADPNDLTVKRNIGVAFVANSWIDLNYDGRADFNEYTGIKDRFYDDEDMILAIHNDNQVGQGIKDLKIVIYNPKRKIGFAAAVFDNWDGSRLNPQGSKRYKLNKEKLLKKGGYGSYVIVLYSEGITKMTKFEIIPSSERSERK